jgi:hypothetical protein
MGEFEKGGRGQFTHPVSRITNQRHKLVINGANTRLGR